MRQPFTCLQGHHGEVSLGSDLFTALDAVVCPVCGAAATLGSGPPEEAGGKNNGAGEEARALGTPGPAEAGSSDRSTLVLPPSSHRDTDLSTVSPKEVPPQPA